VFGDAYSKILKTMLCVAIAGTLFITSVFYSMKLLFVVAAFFDWLPLFTRWMRIDGDRSAGSAVVLHGVVTLIAYAIGVAWLFIGKLGSLDLGYLFLVLWFQAVVLGMCVVIAKSTSLRGSRG